MLLAGCALLLVLSSSVFSYPGYQDRIPNGRAVPDPCDPSATWPGVGHKRLVGGGPRNAFGLAFKANGLKWDQTLCNADSDGDGITNGVELGDPECTWTVGATPSSTTGITHPGIDNNNPGCDSFPILRKILRRWF